jgi:hypothetical protein
MIYRRAAMAAAQSLKCGEWISLGLPPVEFRCATTLTNGQSFAWLPSSTCPQTKLPNEWTGVLNGKIISFKEVSNSSKMIISFVLTSALVIY